MALDFTWLGLVLGQVHQVHQVWHETLTGYLTGLDWAAIRQEPIVKSHGSTKWLQGRFSGLSFKSARIGEPKWLHIHYNNWHTPLNYAYDKRNEPSQEQGINEYTLWPTNMSLLHYSPSSILILPLLITIQSHLWTTPGTTHSHLWTTLL